jgi:2-dehydropantoate 2-reductase
MEAITIVGAGGIGCAVGYALASAGATVVFVEADEEKVRWGREHGVQVDRRPARQARFIPFEEWRPQSGRIILLCTKCYDNGTVLARLPEGATVIPIQNGFDPSLDPWLNGVEGIASFVSECFPRKTHTRITRRGRLHLGLRGRGSAANARLTALGSMLRGTRLLRVDIVPDILPYKHTKLMYNAAIGPLAAALGLDNGQLLSVLPARRLFFALLRENYAILRGARAPLARIGPFHPDTVERILATGLVARALSWAFYPTLRGTYCSMHADLPAGRTEIEYYNGHLIQLAGERNCPLNQRIYHLVKRMEGERIPPGLKVLDHLQMSMALESRAATE